MYFELFRASVQAAQLLQAAQQQAEKQLLEADLPPIRLEQTGESPWQNRELYRTAKASRFEERLPPVGGRCRISGKRGNLASVCETERASPFAF